MMIIRVRIECHLRGITSRESEIRAESPPQQPFAAALTFHGPLEKPRE